ncbi:MAG: response regulator [Alphaproteobacteria bacterium]
MDSQIHIAVVDDDPDIREVISTYLSEEGYCVSACVSGDELWTALDGRPAELVILDVRLNAENGFEIAKALRSKSDIGIIMLTAKADVVDRVVGLEVGADDYVVKPFHLRELAARVKSVLRRRTPPGEAGSTETSSLNQDTPHEGSVLRFADWKLDEDRRQLSGPDGDVDLTAGEFDLLVALVTHPQRALSRDQLLDFARGRSATLFDRSIDVQIGRLRRKIEVDPKKPAIIKTVRGAGYMLAVNVQRG